MEQRDDAGAAIGWDAFDAVLFDLDGVLTPTAEIHERAWKDMFDDFLETRAAGAGWTPFSASDYLTYIDGRRRLDGVRAFVASRQIDIPEGEAGDTPGSATIHGLGNAKNDAFLAVLRRDGIQPYPGTDRLLDDLRAGGKAVAVVSSSRNAAEVLAAAGIADRFRVVVDGLVAAARQLPGKPAPDTFLAAASELGVQPDRAVVVEDAISGVAAGHAGGFRLVVGIDRGAGRDALVEHGAGVAVDDLGELDALLNGGLRR